ncbi:MAG: DUF4837 family protein [Cyclobacteriaceae bacterium]
MLNRVYLVSILVVLFSCSETSRGKPEAIGLPGRINIIITPELKNGPVGKILDSLLTAELEVTPRDESLFNIKFVEPDAINRSHKSMRNLIIAFTFSDRSADAGKVKSLITTASLEKLQTDTSAFVITQSDTWARGQDVMYLFSGSPEKLASKILEQSSRLVSFFNEKEKERLRNGILKSNANKALTESILKKNGFSIRIPFGFQLADQQENFVWLRQINPLDDKDIWVARKKFTGLEDFSKDRLIRFRNEVCRKYLFEDPEKADTYLVTETSVPYKPVLTRTINFKGKYAVEVKGLWKTNIPSMGGPFIGYAFVDEANGYFYYIEGFVFSPSKSQREILRELDVILSTFSLPEQKEKSDKKTS